MQVAKGQRAVIGSDFLPDKQFDGWVKRISPVVDPRSGTFKVTVGVSDRFEALRPGIFVSVRIVTDTHDEAVSFPKTRSFTTEGNAFLPCVIPLPSEFCCSRVTRVLSRWKLWTTFSLEIASLRSAKMA